MWNHQHKWRSSLIALKLRLLIPGISNRNVLEIVSLFPWTFYRFSLRLIDRETSSKELSSFHFTVKRTRVVVIVEKQDLWVCFDNHDLGESVQHQKIHSRIRFRESISVIAANVIPDTKRLNRFQRKSGMRLVFETRESSLFVVQCFGWSSFSSTLFCHIYWYLCWTGEWLSCETPISKWS